MKKGLLFALALGIGTFAIGQNNMMQHYKINNTRPANHQKMDMPGNDIAGPVKKSTSTKGVIAGHNIGFSNNIYTALVEAQTVLDYNSTLGLLSYTHRGKIGDSGATGSGDIMISNSTDGGTTWSTNLYLADDAATPHYNRYPSSAIYNPAANTDIANAYVVYSGPSHKGGDWDFNYFGSGKLDATGTVNDYVASQGAFIRNSMDVTDDGKVHLIGASTIETPYAHDTTYVMTGTFNSTTNAIDWSAYKLDHYNFVVGSDGKVEAYAFYWQSAFSADGNTGYFWTIGRDATNDYRAFMPIVWKTTDAGATWTQMPVFDFSTITNLTDHLRPMLGSTDARPSFSNKIDGVVDINGDLHLLSYIKSAFSDHNDSLGYNFLYSTNEKSNPVMDIFTTSTGWDAVHLGDKYTFSVPDKESGYGTGTDGQGWDLRLQASRTDDGTKVFASWTDTDTNNAYEGSDKYLLNMFPDAYVAGYDVVRKLKTPATNFTFGTDFEGDFFYHYMADITGEDNGTYTVHLSKISKGADPLQPITHVFMEGIEFVQADFVANPGFEASIDNSIKVSQNRPNPFNGNTQIDVNLDKTSNLSIEVINITGQTVYSMDLGRKASGIHTINLNSNNLSSGIYFYTVTAGNAQVTKKMIVR